MTVYKWKNHFYEIKGDVGMSLHEKERNKKMHTPRHKVTHNPIPTSLFFQDHNVTYFAGNWMSRCCAVCFANALTNKQTNKQHVKAKQRCRDGVMSDFVSLCRHLLVPFDIPTSPPHFIEMIFSTCKHHARWTIKSAHPDFLVL